MESIDLLSGLSENEKRVLHALVRYPEYSDQRIHSKISMKKSTFSSIKARLRERGYYRKYFVPNFPKLGFELMMVMHMNLNRFTSFDERMRVAGETIKEFQEDFRVISESNKAFNLSISQNLTEFSKNQEEFLKIYSDNRFLTREGVSTVAFPFEISRIRSFMDYEPLIARFCDLEPEEYEDKLTIPTGKVKPVKLTKAEKKVLYGLVKYPEESDTFISEKVEVSRNTVANAKKKFIRNEVCFPKIVPDLEKLGLKLLVFTYRKFNPKTTMKERQEAAHLVRKVLAPHFYLSKNLEGVLISAHTSFEEYNVALDEVMKYYLKHEYITEEPVTYQISISNLNAIKEFNFIDLLLKQLGLTEDDFN